MASTTMRLLLIAGLLISARTAHGEGGCPPGYQPTGVAPNSQNPVGCRPMQSYDEAPRQPPPPPRPPPSPLEWVPDWGAVAVDTERWTVGASARAPTQSSAQDSALEDCRSKGGVACKIAVTYEDGCVALAASNVAYAVQPAATEMEAEVRAIQACTDTGHEECQVQYKDCSRNWAY
ncbi:DUF4189 domain-containing protein [Rhodanobacter lindaniclasticus]